VGLPLWLLIDVPSPARPSLLCDRCAAAAGSLDPAATTLSCGTALPSHFLPCDRQSIRSHQLTRSTPARGTVERTWVYACGYCKTLDAPRENQSRFTEESPLGDEPEYGCLDPGSICVPGRI